MCLVAGEVADGLRPHPICTRKYIEEIMLPAARKGAEKAGRSMDNLGVVVNPLLVTAPDESQLAERMENVRARLAFYASTPAYRAVFDTHGWTEVAERLSALSKQ